MKRIGGTIATLGTPRAIRASLTAVLLVLVLVSMAANASAQTAPAASTSVTVSVPFGGFAAYSFQSDVSGKKIGITSSYSPIDPQDKGVANADGVPVDVYGPASLPPNGVALGTASGPAGKQYFQVNSSAKGQYVLVVHNWDSMRRTATVTLQASWVGGSALALTPVSGAAATAATAAPKAPAAAIEIVAVKGNAALPGAIVRELENGTKVAMYTNGLSNVPVDVPVVLAANADGATKYAWTLTTVGGSKSALDKKDAASVQFTPDKVGVYKVDLVASNAVGSSPMASVQITAGTFIGVEKGGCVNCHAKEVKDWKETGHAEIFTREIQGGVSPATSHYGEGCIRCHTTGYFVGANNGGFTDAQAKTGWKFPAPTDIQAGIVKATNFPAAIQNMANIQCEDCHGPAAQHVQNGTPMAKTLDSNLCGSCHDGGGNHAKNSELANSKHSEEDSQAWTYPTGPSRQACVRCHSGEGYVSFIKNPTEMASWNNKAESLQCASCHDPHGNGNAYQLRIVGKPVALPGGIDKDFGLSATCTECHNARTTAADALKGSFPHYSAAAEMMAGVGGVDYGQTVPNSIHGLVVGAAPVRNPAAGVDSPLLFSGEAPGPCVACHMWPTPAAATKDPNRLKVGEHSFNVVSPDGKTDYAASCQSCHPGIKDFDIEAKADYDGNGKVEPVQTEVAGLLHTLEKAINASGIRSIVGNPYFNRDDLAKATDKQENAIYNYRFVRGLEGGEGKASAIHNFKRSVSLLQLSYKDLTGTDVPGATLMK
ncbi:MAG: cytochrome c3 family protein [Chloroflexota bacterium]